MSEEKNIEIETEVEETVVVDTDESKAEELAEEVQVPHYEVPEQIKLRKHSELEAQKTVSELQAQINALSVQIERLESERTQENFFLLKEEILNLLDGVGSGYSSRHYHESGNNFEVYNSRISGVKNLRIEHRDGVFTIWVKTLSPAGYLLPAEIEVRGTKYHVKFFKSRNFTAGIDY